MYRICFFRGQSYYRIRVLDEPISCFIRSLDSCNADSAIRLYYNGFLVARSAYYV